ncbi:MAG: Type IV secretory pathway VirB4 component-like protein [Candidatus Gottesmanbacteria bacterium GW2011_GWA1_48_13]|uniref:Type IV secretory pathway VirB4 component-like protein n=1 Tax=Candidatus Gottesmanbacteria bacterium GW2011_GWA1_48_13 TaxID=1618439 RepID=A0A0G1UPC6_9BACT|nr:MAG: Type IV secretory pathway VirB4 component-like protein [Candidatus Gottesmanbacteria bacterium GW2011_GWA1_48_13]
MDAKTILKMLVNPMPEDKKLGGHAPGPLLAPDVIAPPSIEVDFDHLKIGDRYFRTLFVAGYPRFVTANWLEPLVSFNHTLDICMYIYPTKSEEVLENLKRKVGEMEATIQSDMKRGRVIEPSVQVALEDALALQQELAKGAERFFQFGLYITIPAVSLEDLNKTTKQVEATLASLLILTKKAVLQMEEGLKTTLPMGTDRIMVTRNMDTTSLATTFPFTSSELTANEGILYGINEHNDSLVIFDRFSLENANMVVFGKSGSGKSYMVKLEVMRSLMFDTEVIIIDPENEYEALTHALGGEYIRFHFGTTTKINPFDLALLHHREGEEESELNQKILSLHGFFRVVMGKLTPTEDALLDRALILTYKQKGITPDPATQNKEPPLMEDLYKALIGMEEPLAKGLADRIEKFVKGSLVGIFDAHTNVEIRNPLTVFSIRDLEDELRPIAMYLILDFIWTKIRRDTRRRMLVVDEAWYMMKYPDSGAFLNSIAKRARKYYLGVTTITQDVEDFLSVDLGKAIIQNSSLQILLKQSSAAIDKVAEIFYLSEGEKHLLLAADIGEGLFFAGPAHAAVRVIASPEEHELATTKPQELEQQRVKGEEQRAEKGHQTGVPQPDLMKELSEPELPPAPNRPSISPPPNRPIFTVEQIENK